MKCQIIILAGGKGKRMRSHLPKVMHEVYGKPMLKWVVDHAQMITNDIVIVYSYSLKQYLEAFQNTCKFVLQEKPLGTAHATYCALDQIDKNKITIVIYGDNPNISSDIILQLYEHILYQKYALVVLGFELKYKNQCGKLVFNANNKLLKIVEFKNARDEEKKLKICNSGIMAFNAGILHQYLPTCIGQGKNANDESYLTELVEMCRNNGEDISYSLSTDAHKLIGINTREELKAFEDSIYKNQSCPN